MNPSRPIMALFGLGLPELIVVLIVLAMLATLAAVALWAVVFVIRNLRKTEVGVPPPAASGGAQKKCPDCAESVLLEARVCKHCGYRFKPEEARSA